MLVKVTENIKGLCPPSQFSDHKLNSKLKFKVGDTVTCMVSK